MAFSEFLLESWPSLGKFRRMSFSSRIFATAVLAVLTLLPIFASAQNTPNFVTAEEQAAGWRLLFDGKNVTGLRGVQKMDFLNEGWKVQDGALVLPKTVDQSGRVTGGDLTTAQQFSDFEFSFEYKLSVSGASGVLYGAHAGFGQKPYGYEFQIIDDVHNPDGLKGGPIRQTGALYGVLPPGENKRINSDGWNSGRIVVQGAHVEHWVNHEKVLEYDYGSPRLMRAISTAVSASFRSGGLRFGPGFGMKSSGPIMLLDKGEEVAFRSLKIRVPAAPANPPATAATGAAPAPLAPLGIPRVGPTPFKSRIPIPGE